MASIFTYDPDPPRVSSPWLNSRTVTPKDDLGSSRKGVLDANSLIVPGVVYEHTASGLGVTKLEAEPQEGPTEYKLHLLLRPRRSFISLSTNQPAGYYRERPGSLSVPGSYIRRASDSIVPPENLAALNISATASVQVRQHRLEQLTTQLLWRLQQSSPYHSSAAHNLILPQLPEVSSPQLIPAVRPGALLPGLEESKGALYEIGVSDDGTFVGLAEDELQESLTNLQAMASSLGCIVEVLRKVAVGECQWGESSFINHQMTSELKTGTLWVAEALVRPVVVPVRDRSGVDVSTSGVVDATACSSNDTSSPMESQVVHSPTQQLRVTLTGSTMSGKSSLLGSLSTATLDNGRGKSRLSLLKHRHEIVSGMTSSITQELIGYQTSASSDRSQNESAQVVNYASDNVSAWTDIHERAEHGRVVFLSDSAGHPRYRRTTLRGLVGWAPHWTLLCIPADNVEDTSGRSGSTPQPQELLGAANTDVDLSQAHLELCLKLNFPLVVVITKLDLASKAGLRLTLAKLLSTLKAAGKRPCIIPDAASSTSEVDLQSLSKSEFEAAKKIVASLDEDGISTVPILLTSSVKGTGVSKLHALLRELPIAPPAPLLAKPGVPSSPSTPLFYIEDVYGKLVTNRTGLGRAPNLGTVISGYLRHGTINTGDELYLGPFTSTQVDDSSSPDQSDNFSPPRKSLRRDVSDVQTSRSFPGALYKSETAQSRGLSPAVWRRIRIVSLRNLRLPVRTLRGDQVGTIGVESVSADGEPMTTPSLVGIRKGMVLVETVPPVRRLFEAVFEQPAGFLSVGSAAVVYIASVRASAKVVSTTSLAASLTRAERYVDEHFGFGFDDAEEQEVNGSERTVGTRVTFQFLASREFIEPGAKILVMPGGGPGFSGGTERGEKGFAGLAGFVGRVE